MRIIIKKYNKIKESIQNGSEGRTPYASAKCKLHQMTQTNEYNYHSKRN